MTEWSINTFAICSYVLCSYRKASLGIRRKGSGVGYGGVGVRVKACVSIRSAMHYKDYVLPEACTRALPFVWRCEFVIGAIRI